MRTRLPQRQSTRGTHVPAPTGGINAVDPLSLMPATDAILQTNLVPAEGGLRPRLGITQYGLTLVDVTGFRTLMSYPGSTSAADRLFAVTSSQVFDVTAGGFGLLWQTLDTVDADSGYGIGCPIVTAAGHFFLYCDESNGYHVYAEDREGSEHWEKITAPATTAWAPTTAYILGDRVTNDGGKSYVCTTAGTSAAAGGPTGSSIFDVVDGTAGWLYQSVVDGVDPAELAFAMTWKNRVWFARKDTAEAWYLELGAIYGTATKFDFGSRFPHGGSLVGLWSWTIDGGAGVDDHLVAISSTGDVLVYQGTDPSNASSFSQIGCWYLGGVPAGRNIALAFGGDLLVLSKLGLIPLSKLIAGGEVSDPTIFATAKIRPLFSALVAERGSLRGWHMALNPEDGTLVVAVPDAGGAYTEQYAFSLSRKSWSRYSGIPMLSAEVWRGKLYAGSPDSKVYVVGGYEDLGGAISWSALTAFNALGSPNWKRVQGIRPRIAGTAQVSVGARFDYDDSTPAGTVGTPTLSGATGIGSSVAIACNGTSSAACTLIGFDVHWDEGGLC